MPGWLKSIRIDLTALRVSRDFRLLTAAGMVSSFGSILTMIAVPFQMKQLTNSYLAVGLISAVEFIPMVLVGLYGGALADAYNRQKLVLLSEIALLVCAAGLLTNSLLPHPAIWPLYVIGALAAAGSAIQRPAIDPMVIRYVPLEHQTSAAAFGFVQHSLTGVVGMSLAGVLISAVGVPIAYAVDVLTFLISLQLIRKLTPVPPGMEGGKPSLSSIVDGMRYAVARKDLLGTYIVDIACMFLAAPMALLPFWADRMGGPQVLGFLYASFGLGGGLAALTSGWVKNVHRHGLGVILGAAGFGVGVALAGFFDTLWLVVPLLALGGFADGISGLFRVTIWNQSIPDEYRGRLASIEMLSYLTGPQLAGVRSSGVAKIAGLHTSIISGGVACIAAVGALAVSLPAFRNYDARTDEHLLAERARRAALA
ncbi:MFS transporter [Pseudonocardiaceae bacterium YIM PH 21723]|nr:MFS transporter [Pseudonocardiaceae bacterium YIM PH 21723]